MSCTKAHYRSRKQAKVAARRANASFGSGRLEPYWHNECMAFHYGHVNTSRHKVPCRTCRELVVFGIGSYGREGPLDPLTGRDHNCRAVA
jgi:hypothetical protein